MGLNLTSPTTFTGLFVAPTTQATGGSNDAIQTPSTAVSPGSGLTLPVSAICELKGTNGAFLVPRMTTAEKDALDNSKSTITNGMCVYDTTLGEFSFYQGDAWVSFGSGGGNVTGPGASTDNAIVRWNGAAGTDVANSVVIIDDNGVVSGPISITVNGTGLVSGQITLNNAADTFGTTLIAGNNAADLALELPIEDAAVSGNPLVSDAAAVLSFNPSLSLGTVASLVNYLEVNGSATGNALEINALGSDTNIGIQLAPKGTGSLQNAVGAVATPSYSFTGRLDTGIWSSADDTIDFSTGAERQFQIFDTASAVNWIGVTGAAAGAEPRLEARGTDADIDVALQAKGSGSISVLGTGTTEGGIKFFDDSNTNHVSLNAGNLSGNTDFILPLGDATVSGAPMVSDAAGNLSFQNRAVLYRTVTLSSAQILALSVSFPNVIPAPGAGFGIMVHNWGIEVIGGAAQYANGGNLFLQYGFGGTHASEEINAAVITTAASGVNQFACAPGTSSTTVATSLIDNQAVGIANETAPFITGNGTAVLHLYYSIIPIT